MIKYRDGYKYQLADDYWIDTPITPLAPVVHEFFTLLPSGSMRVKRGYAWDGASGPTFDTKSSMRPSLVHDVFCQMMRSRLLDHEAWKHQVNALFEQHCIEDGMWEWRAALWRSAVEFANAGDPSQGESNPTLTAP